MTVEELQAQVLELQDQINTLTSERDNSQTEVANLNSEITRLRDINQQLFIRATQEQTPEEDTEDEPTLDDVYKEIKW